MPTSLGRIEPIAGPRRPPADEDLPSPEVLRELHRTYVLGKQRTFLAAAPFGLLGTFALVAAARDPQIFGGLLFPAFIGVVAVGRVGYEWLTLRHADPVAVYLREQRESEIVSAQRAEHQARLSEIRPMATIFVTACILAVTAVEFARLASAPVSEVIARAALVKPAVRAGEWWRLLTATYLHGSLVHIAANASALFALG